MATSVQRVSRIRAAVAALVVCLFAFSAVTFYRWGSAATDENLFTEPPSAAYLSAPVAAAGAPAPVLRAGDILLGVGNTKVKHPADVAAALRSVKTELVEVKAHRPTDNPRQTPKATAFISAMVPAAALAAAPLRDIAHTVVVIDVTAGGASDRAGVRVGDVIQRINGATFTNAIEADSVMRASRVGRTVAYEVLRGGQPLTINVTLASFGFELARLAVVLTGLLWMAFGAWLALARPGVRAALLLGLAFILLGYAMSVLVIRRDFVVTAFVFARDAFVLWSVCLGAALFAHAEWYFPREHGQGIPRWALPLAYGTAVIAALACTITRNNALVALSAGLVLLAAAPVGVMARRERGPEERQILRALRWTKAIVGAWGLAVFFAMMLRRNAGPAYMLGLALVAIFPAAYLYTIAKYRLLDLDLRVRRSVQYSLASAGWALLSVCALLAVLWYLPSIRLPLPNLTVSSSSVELLDTPMSDQRRSAFEKGALMLLAIGAAFLFRAIGRGGQVWIADKFHRTAYDYRRASRELADVMSTRLDLDGLADGLIQTLARLMPLKRAGVVFVHGSRSYCGGRAHGFAPDEWSAFCASSSADLVQAAAGATSEIDAEYAFPRLRRALEAADIKYLYPIRSHDRLVGVVLVGEKRSEAAFEDDDFQFLGAAAHQVSAGVENAFLYEELAEQERLRHELEIARRIQLESLPQFTPSVEGLDIAGVSLPAFEVGGDYYDYLDGEPRRLTVVVGDVSGKGTSAALYMSKLQGIFRSLHAFGLPPHELFTRTNELLSRDLERRAFVTALGAFFHTGDRRAVLARAGHLPLYVYRAATGTVDRVLPRGVGFGLSHRELFAEELEEREVAYGPGDVFLFVTDGITECQTVRGEEFGEERLIAELRGLARHATAAAIRDRLVESVRAFAGEAEPVDDQTVVVVRATA